MDAQVVIGVLLKCVVSVPQAHLAQVVVPPLDLDRLVCPGLCASEVVSLAVLHLLTDRLPAAVEAAVMNAAAPSA